MTTCYYDYNNRNFYSMLFVGGIPASATTEAYKSRTHAESRRVNEAKIKQKASQHPPAGDDRQSCHASRHDKHRDKHEKDVTPK